MSTTLKFWLCFKLFLFCQNKTFLRPFAARLYCHNQTSASTSFRRLLMARTCYCLPVLWLWILPQLIFTLHHMLYAVRHYFNSGGGKNNICAYVHRENSALKRKDDGLWNSPCPMFVLLYILRNQLIFHWKIAHSLGFVSNTKTSSTQ